MCLFLSSLVGIETYILKEFVYKKNPHNNKGHQRALPVANSTLPLELAELFGSIIKIERIW